MAQNKKAIHTALLARFSALGDVAMTVPVIYSACRCHPDVRFVMVTRPSMTSIFVDAPENLVLEGIDVKNEYAGVGGIRRLAAYITGKYSPDVFIDLHNVLRTRILAVFLRLSGIKAVHIFKPRAKRRALTRRHSKVMLPLISQRARYREAFFKAGLPATEHFGGLCARLAIRSHFPSETRRRKMDRIRTVRRPQRQDLSARPDGEGGGTVPERCRCRRTAPSVPLRASEYDAATSLAGKKYGFKAELALINHLDVMVSMDSANMHLSAIAGTPTVSVWGATHHYCGFKGWHQQEADMVQVPVACRPCSVFGDKPGYRGDYICLSAIKPDLIYNKMRERLS